MARPRVPEPVLLVVAAFSRYPEALAWARDRLEAEYGPVALASPLYPFHQTTYYEKDMGPGLQKQFLVLERLLDPGRLAEVKLRTNAWEEELARTAAYPEPRPLNLDPGFLTLGKFMLATTKDQAHRIYLRDGIYAEVTLRFQGGKFEEWPWTYRDYREPYVKEFLGQAREYYRQRVRGS